MFCIQKSKRENFENEIKDYAKMSSKFTKISDVVIFNDKIAKAQSKGREEALKAYDEVYEPNLNGLTRPGANLTARSLPNSSRTRLKFRFLSEELTG